MTPDGPLPEPETGTASGASLIDLLEAHATSGPAGTRGEPSPEDLLEEFAIWAAGNGLTLYPAQEDALLELASGSHVILSTPTGSGKSLVAIGAMFFALAQGRRTYYTAPIKALVSEKFFDLCDLLGPERVGMITGDAAVNPEAPVICATAEILANLALRQGTAVDVGRGLHGRVPLLRRPGPRLGLADPAHRADERPVPADVRDPRRHAPDPRRPHAPDRPARRDRGGRRAARPLDLLVRPDSPSTRRSRSSWRPIAHRSTSCTPRRPWPWSGPRR